MNVLLQQLWIAWCERLRKDHFTIVHRRSEILEFRRNMGVRRPTRFQRVRCARSSSRLHAAGARTLRRVLHSRNVHLFRLVRRYDDRTSGWKTGVSNQGEKFPDHGKSEFWGKKKTKEKLKRISRTFGYPSNSLITVFATTVRKSFREKSIRWPAKESIFSGCHLSRAWTLDSGWADGRSGSHPSSEHLGSPSAHYQGWQ